MSPRAAWRLESLGFQDVYDYVGGKADWLANGLPGEGDAMAIPRIGDHARNAPTCRLSDSAAEISSRLDEQGWDVCPVTNEEHIVLGVVERASLGDDPAKTADKVMRPGPSTYRPDVSLEEMHHYMRDQEMQQALVTTSDGKLVGVVRRKDVERESAKATGGLCSGDNAPA